MRNDTDNGAFITYVSHYRLTIDGVWIGNQIYWTPLQLVTTFYRSLSHKD
jgi:hypothetical protein